MDPKASPIVACRTDLWPLVKPLLFWSGLAFGSVAILLFFFRDDTFRVVPAKRSGHESEPAFKQTLQSPEERRWLPIRPMAPDGSAVLLSEPHSLNGAPIYLIALGGKGPVAFTVPTSTSLFQTAEFQAGQVEVNVSSICDKGWCDVEFTSGHPFLITNSLPAEMQGRLDVEIRDDAGQVLTKRGPVTREGMIFWFFEPTESSTHVEFELVVRKIGN